MGPANHIRSDYSSNGGDASDGLPLRASRARRRLTVGAGGIMYYVQATKGAFVFPPESAFKTVSGHRSFPRALAALGRLLADQSRRCGYGSWDANYRIKPTESR